MKSNCNFPFSFQGFWLKSKTVLNEESMDQRNSLVCLCLPSKNTLRSRVSRLSARSVLYFPNLIHLAPCFWWKKYTALKLSRMNAPAFQNPNLQA